MNRPKITAQCPYCKKVFKWKWHKDEKTGELYIKCPYCGKEIIRKVKLGKKGGDNNGHH